MRNLTVTLPTLTDDANGICEDQTTAGAGDLSLDGALVSGGVATPAAPQKVSIEGTGDNSGIDFTITGTDPDGTVISETIDGANNGTATSTYYFKTVTGISVDGAVTGNVEAGFLDSNGAVSKSLRVNGQQPDFKLGLFVDMSGTLTYSAQYAYQQPEDSYDDSYSVSADWRDVDSLSALTADGESNLFYKVQACRLYISAYTSGSATLTVTQSY